LKLKAEFILIKLQTSVITAISITYNIKVILFSGGEGMKFGIFCSGDIDDMIFADEEWHHSER